MSARMRQSLPLDSRWQANTAQARIRRGEIDRNDPVRLAAAEARREAHLTVCRAAIAKAQARVAAKQGGK